MGKLREYLAPFVIASLIVFGVIVAIHSNDTTGTSEGTREVLCRGIMLNAENTSRFDPRLVTLCAEVGVHPVP